DYYIQSYRLTSLQTLHLVDQCSSTSLMPGRNFSIHSHTNQAPTHPATPSRCTYTYTPSSSHSLTLLSRLPDHHSSLLLLGNLEFWRMDSGFRVSIRKDSNDFAHYHLFCGFAFFLAFANLVPRFHLLSLKFLLVDLRCNSVLHYPNDRYSCRY